ncbi:hypothetical protein [Burkholderia thailandensis]|uniref:hypothetical protein n=1 Tax=Burkholderia thailandensis TaxID=57975 RepID=UPI0012DB4EBF|nr:hypothetical protein [Burkholderia thailandensis]MBS2131381.1 hypothetical protein [Burkholderia thailandensis]MCS6507746.1 hypothetical protein [Burkholderia thailandensis]NBD05797.1 hypothetical protein [Burkholderia thailandensis]QRA14042.1 hypothetical protein JMY07_18370 [Burkholderia thailandensis]WRS69282.1 hypothetical protein U9S59_21305 [Burkholderia thailandensis]
MNKKLEKYWVSTSSSRAGKGYPAVLHIFWLSIRKIDSEKHAGGKAACPRKNFRLFLEILVRLREEFSYRFNNVLQCLNRMHVDEMCAAGFRLTRKNHVERAG